MTATLALALPEVENCLEAADRGWASRENILDEILLGDVRSRE